MKFESFFRPKPKEELEKQVENIETENDIKLTHESMEEEAGLLDVAELKEKYKVRYDTYLEMLRAERRGDDLQESDFYKAKVLINALNNLDDYIVAQEKGEHRVLRGRQIPVFNEIRDALERGVDAGYVHLPTGVGKTVLFTQLIEATKLKALIGVPSLPLVKNTGKEVEKRTTKTYGEYTGKQKDTSQDITTITYPSLINAVREEKVGKEEFPLIILDEAHKALGHETEKAINSLSGIKIGFTATPNYSAEHAVSKLLPEEIYTMTIREAIQEGLSCRTKTIHAYTEVDMSSVPIQKGKYDEEGLEKALNVKGRNVAALELYKNKFSHLKAMVNCCGIKHSKAVAELFQEQGIKAAHIDGTMSDTERDDIIGKLETGEIMVVTNAKLLLEGFDEQSLAVALNLSPTLSFINAEQRGGRALRLEEGNASKWAYVVDFIDKNPKKKQVLFSEILEGDIILPSNNGEREKIQLVTAEEEISEEVPINFEDLNIDGLRVVVNTKEILEVTKQYQESREVIERKKWTYESLRQDVLAKGIKSYREYVKNSQVNQWPAPLTVKKDPLSPKNSDGSFDWHSFLNQEKPTEWTYETLREDVLSKGIKSSSDYLKFRKHNKWPDYSTFVNMKNFPKNLEGTLDWDKFLNREKRKEWTYESLYTDVISKGIQSTDGYKRASKDYHWPDLKRLMKINGFPKNLDNSPDWDTFFGREGRKKWTYESLREDVIRKGIKSSEKYKLRRKEEMWPDNIVLTNKPEFPKNPDGSNNWSAFLGVEKHKEWTYKVLRGAVLASKINTYTQYNKLRKEKQWPVYASLLNMSDFPRNQDGKPDWKTFFDPNK